MAILEEVGIPGEEIAAATPRYTELRNVVLAGRVYRPDGEREVTDGRFEEELASLVTEENPRMAAVRGSGRHPAANHEVGIDIHLEKLPPRPEGEVLTVTPAQVLERRRMLPEVLFLE
jgi:hypothetical protein